MRAISVKGEKTTRWRRRVPTKETKSNNLSKHGGGDGKMATRLKGFTFYRLLM